MSEHRYGPLLLLASMMVMAGCTPPRTTGDSTPPATGVAAAPADLDTHHQQVEQDAQAFLEYQRGAPAEQVTATPATDPPIIKWNRKEGDPPAAGEANVLAVETVATSASEPAAGNSQQTDGNSLRRSMIDFSRELYTGSTWSDQPMKELLVLASMSMIDPERALDANAIPDLTEEERELLEAMQAWFTAVGQSLESDADPWKVLVNASDQLQRRLKRIPDLKLPSVALCTRVSGFGDYDEWTDRGEDDGYSFIAHTRQPVIIYAEMEGFESELNDRELWETVTSQHLTIYSDRDGIPVWKEDWQTAADRSQNQRRDYFTVQQLTLPSGLSVGRYRLKLRVRDEKSGAEVERNIPFTMTAGVLE